MRIVQDDAVLVRGDAATRDRALDELRDGGADVVRAIVRQGDPWVGYDGLVDAARARGLRVLLTLTPRPRASPVAFGRFARTAGRRYGGRVDRWALVNEPNSPRHILPQRRGGHPASPATYRRLVRAGLRGLEAAGQPARRVLIGELLGTGLDSRGARSPVRPLGVHARLLLPRPPRPPAALRRPAAAAARARLVVPPLSAARRAGGGAALAARRHRVAPRGAAEDARRRLARRAAPRAACRCGTPRAACRPIRPIASSACRRRRQARFINWTEWILWRTPTVRSVAQYLWRDEPDPAAFQTGLRYADGRAKPALAAWRLPLHLRRTRGGALEVWARLPRGAARGTVTIGGRRACAARAPRPGGDRARPRAPRGVRAGARRRPRQPPGAGAVSRRLSCAAP